MKPYRRRRIIARFNWDRLKVSLWFTPLVMSAGALVLVWVLTWVDMFLPNEYLETRNLILAGSNSELRGVLVNNATTVLATAGVVFSLMTLPLSTVAAQYGSRLLRVFLADRTTQTVLGMFAATIVYSIAAALTIPQTAITSESPQLVVTFSMILMLATFGSLILLIQHISTMLQAPNIAAAAGAELRSVIRDELGDDGNELVSGRTSAGQATSQPGEISLVDAEAYALRLNANGYIQYVDLDYMLSLARELDLVIRLRRRPGEFVWNGAIAALAWPASRINGELEKHLRRSFQVGRQRTPVQDIEYGVNQLAEIAVRAMSPAINDPFTAQTCLDYIAVGLAQFVQQPEESPDIYDQDGRLRLIIEPVTFSELLSAGFDMLRHCSSDNGSVLLHMLEVIGAIGQATKSPEAAQELLRHVNLIQAESQVGALIEQDRQLIKQKSDALQSILA